MSSYYVFDLEQTAIDAEAYICLIAQTPITGVNGATGQPEPTKAKTERWAEPVQRITDNKWVFPCIPDAIAEQYPPEVTTAFNTNFPNTKEEYVSSWFSTEA